MICMGSLPNSWARMETARCQQQNPRASPLQMIKLAQEIESTSKVKGPSLVRTKGSSLGEEDSNIHRKRQQALYLKRFKAPHAQGTIEVALYQIEKSVVSSSVAGINGRHGFLVLPLRSWQSDSTGESKRNWRLGRWVFTEYLDNTN